VILKGVLVWSGTKTYCATGLAFDENHNAGWVTRNLDVSAATKDGPAEMRLIVRAGTATLCCGNAVPHIFGDVRAGMDFEIRSLYNPEKQAFTGLASKRKAVGRSPAFAAVACTGPPEKITDAARRFVGVPRSGRETAKKWKMRIEYTPADAKICSIQVPAEVPGILGAAPSPFVEVLNHDGGPTGACVVSRCGSASGGCVELTNVGFANLSSRPLWDAKQSAIRVGVNLEAQMLDGTMVQSKDYLVREGLKPRLAVFPESSSPLYDAGDIPGALRYSGRDPGQDGWATKETNEYLVQNQAATTPVNDRLVFNDISFEHGGPNPDHTGHRCGYSIDTRYFAPGGDSNPLNGTAAATLEDADMGKYRENRLMAARGGDAAAQVEIVDWILATRIRIQQLAADPGVCQIGIGNAKWNMESLLNGKYEDGTLIRDSAGREPGAWPRPAKLRT
jgi:hypothetical protein